LREQEEDFDEDEGIYDDLNLDEEESKFGLAPDDDDSDESDFGSEGINIVFCIQHFLPVVIDLPPRTPNKKLDEESVSSGKREADSPVLKKAPVTLQLRSKYLLLLFLINVLTLSLSKNLL
jgi:CCR4-NOT transcription complex subunit 3